MNLILQRSVSPYCECATNTPLNKLAGLSRTNGVLAVKRCDSVCGHDPTTDLTIAHLGPQA